MNWADWAPQSTLRRRRANIAADENVSLLSIRPAESIDVIMKRSKENMLESQLAQVFGRAPFHAWMRGRILRIMPQWVVVR